jgi:predicted secreted Zn-dependent protease
VRHASDDGLAWRKARASAEGNCVEVATDNGRILIRDSKDPDGPRLAFSRAEWSAFLAGVKSHEFD